MVLYLVRHGESTDNILGRYTGQADPPLSPLGRTQAARLAAVLAGAALAAVYASDLRRAAATARAVARPHGLPVRWRAALREVDMGAWTGLTYPELEANWPEHLAGWPAPPPWPRPAARRWRRFTAAPCLPSAGSGTTTGPPAGRLRSSATVGPCGHCFPAGPACRFTT